MDVEMFDVDLAAAVPKRSGQEFSESAGTFPD